MAFHTDLDYSSSQSYTLSGVVVVMYVLFRHFHNSQGKIVAVVSRCLLL